MLYSAPIKAFYLTKLFLGRGDAKGWGHEGMGSSLVIYSLYVVYPSPSSPVLDMPMSGLRKSIYY